MSKSTALGEEHDVALSSGRIRYRETGSGSPIVFLHGIVANGDLWRKVVPQLAAGHRCITPDWPLGSQDIGMDESADFSLPGLAQLVDEFLGAMDLDGVTLVANDTGGAIAQWVMIRHPERLARVVITPCDAFDNFLPPVLRGLQILGRRPEYLWVSGQAMRWRFVQRLPFAFGHLTERPIDADAMESYTQAWRTNSAVRHDFAKLAKAISSKYTQQSAEELPHFGKPVLVAWARQSKLFPLEHGEQIAERLPQGTLKVVEDSGVFIPEDQPQQLATMIEEFVGAPAPAQTQTQT
jgi:pimeloyl-ACP methyl ester carboxylesterase